MTVHTIFSLLLLLCLPQFRLAFGLFGFTTNGLASTTMRRGSEFRIIGGENVSEGELPFAVHLRLPKGECSGMIIHEEWVLTAAHCITKGMNDQDKEIIRIYSGGIQFDTETSNTQVVNSSKVIVHQDYEELLKINDIALIQVVTPFDFSGCCVKKGKLVAGKFPPVKSMECTIVGFGRTSDVPGAPENDLLFRMKVNASVLLESFWMPYYINQIFDLHPLAYPEESGQQVSVNAGKGKNICSGDSGGPLVCNGLLTGICSYSKSKVGAASLRFVDGVYQCAEKNSIGVYNFIGYHIDWIRGHVPGIEEPGSL